MTHIFFDQSIFAVVISPEELGVKVRDKPQSGCHAGTSRYDGVIFHTDKITRSAGGTEDHFLMTLDISVQ